MSSFADYCKTFFDELDEYCTNLNPDIRTSSKVLDALFEQYKYSGVKKYLTQLSNEIVDEDITSPYLNAVRDEIVSDLMRIPIFPKDVIVPFTDDVADLDYLECIQYIPETRFEVITNGIQQWIYENTYIGKTQPKRVVDSLFRSHLLDQSFTDSFANIIIGTGTGKDFDIIINLINIFWNPEYCFDNFLRTSFPEFEYI